MAPARGGPSVALVTGASSGLGARTAAALARRGHRVAGAARRTDAIAALPGVRPIRLDLTDPASVEDAVATVTRELGPVEVLVNNAGYGAFGPLEETPLEDARRQFEVNVFGLVALTGALLPAMRAAGRGRIVNVSSVAGEFSSPLGGWYHASKYALEALSDSLRQEVRPFGIDVTVVQPGPVRTAWHEEAMAGLDRIDDDSPYRAMATSVAGYHRRMQGTAVASDPDRVAAAIVRAATAARPRPRYRVGAGTGTAVALSRLPARLFDAMTRRQFRLP